MVFFLAEVFYAGKYGGSLLYTLFFFVVGAVLVGRIAVQADRSRAWAYGGVLAVVTFIALRAWVDYPPDIVWFGSARISTKPKPVQVKDYLRQRAGKNVPKYDLISLMMHSKMTPLIPPGWRVGTPDTTNGENPGTNGHILPV